MAGGTHADNTSVEDLFGIALTATSKPFTSTQVDAMCVQAELIINIYLNKYGTSLPTSANTQWEQIVALVVKNMMDLGDKWDKAGGSTSTASEMGTAQYANYGSRILTQEVRFLIDSMMAASGGAAAYGDSLSTSD
jgi:hypothetical protein